MSVCCSSLSSNYLSFITVIIFFRLSVLHKCGDQFFQVSFLFSFFCQYLFVYFSILFVFILQLFAIFLFVYIYICVCVYFSFLSSNYLSFITVIIFFRLSVPQHDGGSDRKMLTEFQLTNKTIGIPLPPLVSEFKSP